MLLGQGTVIAGRYIVERKIGEGAWGEVWLGHHTNVGMRVAIKALLAAKVESHDAVVRFEREAKFLGRIQSDYVARVLDFLNDEIHGLILVMEYVEGESLADLLAKGKLDVERAIDLGCDLVAGLCDLHAARVVHRDMKPANVILRPLPDGRTRAVIIDFSLGRMMARPGEDESSITQLTGVAMAVGTLPYMPPEQVLDSRKVTPASDLYALGAVLYRCVTGNYVFTDVGDAIVARKKLTSEAPRLETGRTDALAEGFADVIARALRRRPEDRYADAHSMLKELIALRDAPRMARVPSTEVATASAVERESTENVISPGGLDGEGAPRRSRARLTVAGIALLAIGMALGLAAGRARWGVVPAAAVAVVPSASSEASTDAAASSVAAVALRDADSAEAEGDGADDGASNDPPASSLSPVTADTPPVVKPWPFVRASAANAWAPPPLSSASSAPSVPLAAPSVVPSAATASAPAAPSAPPSVRTPSPSVSVRPVE